MYVHMLRNVAERMNVAPLRELALSPGTKAVYRVIVHYDKLRASDTTVTLRCLGTDTVSVEAVYLGYFGHKPIIRRMSVTDYEGLIGELSKLRFDNLSDQPNIPFYGTDVWLIERAANTFLKSVAVAPQVADGQYKQLIEVISRYLPETRREIV